VTFPRGDGEEEGQVIPALLLAVVAIVFLGLLFSQVGSAAEQKTQTRTVADSAAVAATHLRRDATLVDASHQLTNTWAIPIFATIPPLPAPLRATACAAAQRNWTANPHRKAFSCGADLAMTTTGDGVQVDVAAPSGQVVTGPVDVSAERAKASATTRIVLDRCPRAFGAGRAVADWIADQTMRTLGASSSCFDAGDEAVFEEFDLYPATAAAAIGPPQPILDAVRAQLRVQIVA
jgi:hypothetical protein